MLPKKSSKDMAAAKAEGRVLGREKPYPSAFHLALGAPEK
jgi:hypothetical protein